MAGLLYQNPVMRGMMGARMANEQSQNQELNQVQGLLGMQTAQIQQGLLAQQMQDKLAQQARIEQFANTLPPDKQQLFRIDPPGFIKNMNQQRVIPAGGALAGPDGQIIATVPTKPQNQSNLSRLIAERDLLEPNDPRRTTYDNAIRKESETARQISPTIVMPRQERQPQVIQTANGPMILGADGSAKPIAGPDGKPVVSPVGRGNRPMSSTAQKELIETDEQIQGGAAALDLFKQAVAINDKAMGFTGAAAVASAGSLLPEAIRPAAVDATQNLDNILQSGALPQLKAIFGGMPTEGERKILLDVQGSSSKPPKVRKEIFDRAMKAIQARMKFSQEKAKALRDGSYFSGDGGVNPTGAGSSGEWKDL